MTKQYEALKQALDALVKLTDAFLDCQRAFIITENECKALDQANKAISSIEEALAQPEPFAPDWANYRQGKIDGAREAMTETGETE